MMLFSLSILEVSGTVFLIDFLIILLLLLFWLFSFSN